MFKIFLHFAIVSIGTISLNAQNCQSNFITDAGPDINVCEGGSVNLGGVIGGDATKAVWRGGKGTFSPDRQTLSAEYTPDISENNLTIVLTLVSSKPGMEDCVPGRDDIKVTVNSAPVIEAGENVSMCPGQIIELSAKLVSGDAEKFIWSSTGTGSFKDPNSLTTNYNPSQQDIINGGCTVTLVAKPYGVCLPYSDALSISIPPTIKVTSEEQVNYEDGKPVKLGISVNKNEVEVQWKTTGSGNFNNLTSLQTNYTPSEQDRQKSKILLTVIVSPLGNSCPVVKEIILNMN